MKSHGKAKARTRRSRYFLKRLSWISALFVLLSVYMGMSFYVTIRSEEHQPGWSHDWQEHPHSIPQHGATEYQAGYPNRQLSTQVEDVSATQQSWLAANSLSTADLHTIGTSQSSTPKFGFVMRDFARRVLSRHISSSNVLVISPDAVRAAKEGMYTKANNNTGTNIYDHVDFESPYSLGGTFLLHAALEGHDIHAIDFVVAGDGEDAVDWRESLDTWWSSFDRSANKVAVDPSRRWSSSTVQPRWIIAAVFDMFTPDRLDLADAVFSEAGTFFNESTITYMVVGMHSRKRNGRYEFGGIAAARVLLEHRYKLQTLLLSHFYAPPGNESWTEQRYGPNAIFKTQDDIEELLSWGADQASRHGNEMSVFTAYIFATQGLDLAIPSSRVFIDDSSRVMGPESTQQINLYKSIEFKPCPQARISPHLQIEFSEILGDTSIKVVIPLEDGENQIRHYHPRANKDTGFTYQFTRPDRHFLGPRPEEVEIWFSNENLNDAEAVCARFGNFSKCTTRVIDRTGSSRPPATSTSDDERLNIFLIMIDPISRPHFHRTMPNTAKALRELGFVEFGNYTAVGPNSGKNQAALYSGIPLADRNGINKDATSGRWLWDRLNDNGFVTLKAEDGCIENSNMLKSLRPSTTHGSELSQLFCFDFDRPNCLGPDLAAEQLMAYGDEFLRLYETKRREENPNLRWAAFLHFIDTHEDTMVLSSMLDKKMSAFLSRVAKSGHFDRTLALVTSDHGLHYGPYFQSRSGRREAVHPVLFVRAPAYLERNEPMSALYANIQKWITPFDVHETMVSVSAPKDVSVRDGRRGTSLLVPWQKGGESCGAALDIPAEYCSLKIGLTSDTSQTCTRMPRPPNILSFYSDIGRDYRTRFSLDCGEMWNSTASKANSYNRCQCATSHRGWYRCDKHPWGDDEILSESYPEEYFALVQCRGRKMSYDTRLLASHPDLERSRALRTTESESPASILIIEVDSASLAYAQRHLPKTRSFLQRYQMKKLDDGKIDCSSGICAPEFTHFSLNGPNSIANQIPTLSGCIVARFHHGCFMHQDEKNTRCSGQGKFESEAGECVPCPDGSFLVDPLSECRSDDGTECCTTVFPSWNASRICHDPSRDEYGLQLFRRGPRRHVTYCPITENHYESPWIFDVAKKLGYFTYFGDEFCYEGSPFVAQNNIFPLAPNLELQRLYCRLEESRQYKFAAVGPRLCADSNLRWGAKSSNPGFDLIRELWGTPDLVRIPKLVYLNAMAAHNYDPAWMKMVSVAEEYDEQLLQFLEFIILHESFANTVVVVRADHGLQGGPATVEYSMQVEHREPWTHVLLPKALVGDSGMTQLYANQRKIVTGGDLYLTLRSLMESSSSSGRNSRAARPPWSYNLIHDSIPATRTCKDAKVPIDFCPCEELVDFRPPSFGICNSFDQYGDLFCIDQDDVVLPDILEL